MMTTLKFRICSVLAAMTMSFSLCPAAAFAAGITEPADMEVKETVSDFNYEKYEKEQNAAVRQRPVILDNAIYTFARPAKGSRYSRVDALSYGNVKTALHASGSDRKIQIITMEEPPFPEAFRLTLSRYAVSYLAKYARGGVEIFPGSYDMLTLSQADLKKMDNGRPCYIYVNQTEKPTEYGAEYYAVVRVRYQDDSGKLRNFPVKAGGDGERLLPVPFYDLNRKGTPVSGSSYAHTETIRAGEWDRAIAAVGMGSVSYTSKSSKNRFEFTPDASLKVVHETSEMSFVGNDRQLVLENSDLKKAMGHLQPGYSLYFYTSPSGCIVKYRYAGGSFHTVRVRCSIIEG